MTPLSIRIPNILAAVVVLVGLAFLSGVAFVAAFPFAATSALIIALGCAAPVCVRIIATGGR